MPIPGPSTPVSAVDVAPTGSPFWLSLFGSWIQLEGVTPTTGIESDRPGSEVRSSDGNRYAQRAKNVRRSWEVSLPHAASQHIAALRVAADSDAEAWLMSDAVAAGNMLANRVCFGTGSLVDCGGLLLPSFAGGEQVTGRVRGGVSTTLSGWSSAAAGVDVLSFTYPGGAGVVDAVGGANVQASASFTPTADGVLTITATAGVSGLMLTEGTPLPSFVPGESMPCKVVVDDPGDTLTMFHTGAWRHEYTVRLREVG